MDRSLQIFILLVVVLFISWIAFLVLSTCLGPPLRQMISQAWSKLIEFGSTSAPANTYRIIPSTDSNRFHSHFHYQQLIPMNVEEFELSSFSNNYQNSSNDYPSKLS
ncbi:hypothetical protein O181_104094 [Austropuccinia psidii MF-1]|uniref:Uncharacterized protein n=1 Tax=Austropuccinia psidii MF-1 TaxID=1389203 RepID=A0A9Q3PJU4_9BASI|nr:hypothetical protein [Austropuccinia psidii MF-1]